MKTTRDQLKSLVKELLLEIFQEGLGQQMSTVVLPHQQFTEATRRQPQGRQRPTFDPRLDRPANRQLPTDSLRDAVKREAGGNPVMADILADTAMTTLQSQLSHGDSMGTPMVGTGGGVSRNSAPVQQEQFHGDPSEMFEGAQPRNDGSSHWADLAFMSSKKQT